MLTCNRQVVVSMSEIEPLCVWDMLADTSCDVHAVVSVHTATDLDNIAAF